MKTTDNGQRTTKRYPRPVSETPDPENMDCCCLKIEGDSPNCPKHGKNTRIHQAYIQLMKVVDELFGKRKKGGITISDAIFTSIVLVVWVIFIIVAVVIVFVK
jgi:hypothetical protein